MTSLDLINRTEGPRLRRRGRDRRGESGFEAGLRDKEKVKKRQRRGLARKNRGRTGEWRTDARD